MGQDFFEISVNLVKLIVIFVMMIQMVPVLVWVERRGSAFIQHRFGPNRVGPFGLLQLAADAIKFIMKEEFVPEKANKFLYYAAPVVALVPAALAFAAIPLGPAINISEFSFNGQSFGPYEFHIQGLEMNLGIIYILAVSSLGAFGILLAGWGSANKYSLMGALRGSAQMVSYELALGLAVISMVLIYGTFDLSEIISSQQGLMNFHFWGREIIIPFLPNWGIFFQPVAFVIFFGAAFAETNRLPFDLPEAEGELVVGFHTEYGGFKMLLFFMGEYGHMMVASALAVIFFFGGYQIPFVSTEDVQTLVNGRVGAGNFANVLSALVFHVVFILKTAFFMWVFIWVRWTLPRFKYDRLMDLGWKTMFPWALTNAMVTAVILAVCYWKGH